MRAPGHNGDPALRTARRARGKRRAGLGFHPDAAQMRVPRQARHVIDIGKGNIGADQQVDGGCRIRAGKGRAQHRIGQIPVRHARQIGRQTRIPAQFGRFKKQFGQLAPFPVALDRDQDLLTVAAGKDAIRRD